MVRSNVEIVSQLPVFKAKRSEDFPSWLVVTCPYEDCGDVFLVRSSRWLNPVKRVSRFDRKTFTITGRVCPYCWRSGRLPRRRP